MVVLRSTADPATPAFRRNDEAHRALVAELRERLRQVSAGGGDTARERH
nr:hypothetical protein [Euzebyaceae bacterium]